MRSPSPRSSRPPWLAALAGLALPAAPTLLLLGSSCDDAEPEPPPPPTRASREAPEPAAPPPAVTEAPPSAVDIPAPPAEEAAPPAPIGLRSAMRTTLAYSAPRYGSDLRGRIDLGSAFAVFKMVEGTGCTGDGWAQVDHDSFVCLKHAATTEDAPAQRPIVPEGLVVPFIYAKPKADRKGNLLAEVARYKNKQAYLGGREPLDTLEPHRQYAFVEELPIPGFGKVLRDEDDRIVALDDNIKLEKPSEFFGRELEVRPLPDGRAVAWAISREAVLRREPKLKAKIEGSLTYHQELEVKPEVVRGGGSRWIEVPDGLGAGVSGYVEADKLRVYSVGLPLDDVADDDVWIDVDLAQQTLAVIRGNTPTFVTMISSGTGAKPNTATPKGVFRIRNKLAFGPMRNRPEDAEDSPYHVEAVPWVQYFFKRFALHGAYWHNGFGHRKSHGCVNLAPRDARYVFERTGPNLPPGWMSVYEHTGRPGSVVRVRKGLEPVPDRRTEPDSGPDSEPLLARAEP